MIQIGEAFFDESFCFGIAPDRDSKYSRSCRGSIVFLQNGSRVAIDATTEDVAAALRENGLLTDNDEDENSAPCHLNYPERNELKDCISDNYKYLAKDVRGIVYAFHAHPLKEGAYWKPQAYDPGAKRLIFPYETLDFEDGALLIGDVLFGEEAPF